MSSKAITANRLIDGRVVYLTAVDAWSERFADAAHYDADGVAARLDAVSAAPLGAQVVGAYAIAVEGTPAAPLPHGARERIRTRGPSVRPDLGIQAENG